MSKSLGNYVGLTESPDEIFGKIMSISDELMLRWYDVLEADLAPTVRKALSAGSLHPREAKARLAERQVERFHGATAAGEARNRFDERFSRKALPPEMLPSLELRRGFPGEVQLPDLLVEGGLVKSKSEARRLIGQGAVRIDGKVISTERYRAGSSTSERGSPVQIVVEVGKRRALRFVFMGGVIPPLPRCDSVLFSKRQPRSTARRVSVLTSWEASDYKAGSRQYGSLFEN
jgi:tyrosyl-tRNA synthetase